ncbi:hypothetical protein KJ608_05010 [Patescibacteria group bacterium]|nr:hypothetical protein [Patescibacteria group bacterium]
MSERILLPDVAKVDRIGLLGLGTMGIGWATALLQGGFKDVYAFELNEAAREPAKVEVLKRLKRAQEKGKVPKGDCRSIPN